MCFLLTESRLKRFSLWKDIPVRQFFPLARRGVLYNQDALRDIYDPELYIRE